MAGELQVQVGYRALLAGDDKVAAQALARARGSAEAAGAAGEQRLALIDGSSGLLAIFHGDFDEAASRFLVAQLQGARTLGMGSCLHEGLVGIAAVLAATGEDVAAARLRGAADTFADDPRNGAIRPDGMIARRLDAIFAAARARAGEDFWDGARGAGRALDAAAAVELRGQRPRQFGGRFSMKARTPSAKSSEWKVWCLSASSPSPAGTRFVPRSESGARVAMWASSSTARAGTSSASSLTRPQWSAVEASIGFAVTNSSRVRVCRSRR